MCRWCLTCKALSKASRLRRHLRGKSWSAACRDQHPGSALCSSRGSPHGPPRAGPSSSVLLSRSPWNQQSSVAGRSRDQRFIIVPDKSYANVAQVNTTWSPGHRNAIKVRQRTDKTPTRLRTPQPTQRNHLSPRTNKLRTLIIYNRKAKEQTPERLRNLTEKLTHT